jgi:hypothetical protein
MTPVPSVFTCLIALRPLSTHTTCVPSVSTCFGVDVFGVSATTHGKQVPAPSHVPWKQVCPHAPQLFLSDARLTQAPLQFVVPLHTQVVPLHVWPAPHLMPQPPQSLSLFCRLTHTPLQFVVPLGQQTPVWHVEPAAQTFVQVPQWLASVVRFTQVSLQFVRPPLHAHAPPEHVPPVHTWPHVLQFVADVRRFVSQPVLAFLSQSSKLTLQVPMAHAPPAHAAVAFASAAHAVHEVPQLLTDVLLEHVPLQSCCPDGQPQTPPVHVLPPVHLVPQPPQLFASLP